MMEDEDLQVFLRLLSENNKSAPVCKRSMKENSQISLDLHPNHMSDQDTNSVTSFLNKDPEIVAMGRKSCSDLDFEKQSYADIDVDESKLLSEIRQLQQAHTHSETGKFKSQLDSYRECFPETAEFENWEGDGLQKRKSKGKPRHQGNKKVKRETFKKSSHK